MLARLIGGRAGEAVRDSGGGGGGAFARGVGAISCSTDGDVSLGMTPFSSGEDALTSSASLPTGFGQCSSLDVTVVAATVGLGDGDLTRVFELDASSEELVKCSRKARTEATGAASSFCSSCTSVSVGLVDLDIDGTGGAARLGCGDRARGNVDNVGSCPDDGSAVYETSRLVIDGDEGGTGDAGVDMITGLGAIDGRASGPGSFSSAAPGAPVSRDVTDASEGVTGRLTGCEEV